LTTLDSLTGGEEEFRREAPQHRLVHLIAHGSFGSEQTRQLLARPTLDGSLVDESKLYRTQSLEEYHPNLLSGIALANSGKAMSWQQHDGRLFSEEIQWLDLRGTDLVVLSSCQSALGEQTAGEGLFGIQRAFHAAGARTVIAALWSVQVLATTELMERFYDNLWNKRMDKLTALREAQLWMLRERGPGKMMSPSAMPAASPDGVRRVPPYYWAGFVLSGDWQGSGLAIAER